MQTSNNIKPISLSEFALMIRESISHSLPDSYWIMAEIAALRLNQKGHCYLELVEKQDGSTIAQMRAAIWAYEYRRLSAKFLRETGEFLKDGMKILFLAAVSFHEVYGLSLNIKDIDPFYTLGEMARRKREIISRLQNEGIMELNKGLPLPLVPQRLAIVSSPTAAGYGDFINHMSNNIYGYKFKLKLFAAFMQGEEAERSIINSFKEIKKHKDGFDMAVIIRGGGSQTDLSCFDSYGLASEIARCPLPVISGIGHERDETISDMVAHTKLKTPTAVAEFIISGVRSFEERVIESRRMLAKHAEHLIKDELFRLKKVLQEVTHSVSHAIARNTGKIDIISHRIASSGRAYIERRRNILLSNQKELQSAINGMFTNHVNRLAHMEKAIQYLDPVNVLKRGYSITYAGGRAVKDINSLEPGKLIHTRVYKGGITSKIEALEAYNDEASEETDI